MVRSQRNEWQKGNDACFRSLQFQNEVNLVVTVLHAFEPKISRYQNIKGADASFPSA